MSSLRFIKNAKIEPEIAGDDDGVTSKSSDREKVISLPKIKTNEKAYKPVSYVMVQERENQQALQTIQQGSGSNLNKVVGF